MALLSVRGLDSFFNSSTATLTAWSMPRLMPIGLAPAETDFKPSRTMACARAGGGSAVAGHVGSLGRHFLDHLRAHVLEPAFQLVFFCYGYAVLGHGRRAKTALQYYIAVFRAQSLFDGIGQNIHPASMRWLASSANNACLSAINAFPPKTLKSEC